MRPETNAGATNCGNCGLPMPRELRFCRNCGFRLGEGAAEYTETVRFQNAPPGTLPGSGAGNFGYVGGPLAASPVMPRKRRSRISGTAKLFVALIAFFVLAAAFTSIVKRRSPRFGAGGVAAVAAPRSYAGVDEFKTAEGGLGVTFENVDTPGGPADLAGLVGGDIITTIDGQPVHTEDEMMDMMKRIPIGKTVDVVYIRDGETKNTKLTTISRPEMERLKKVFAARPQGKGRFGFNDDETERVPIAGTKLYGVRVDEISPSLPADMAGIKNGDVIIEFDGVPIRTPEELNARVPRAIPYETIKVVVIRGAERLEIPVKMGKM
ncbi:MAG TPA: PDZ domain-containing protein [Pyrinomonadaceae bacterium]|jgi:membrane-associated protease RseP (regulator of RpoE activity)